MNIRNLSIVADASVNTVRIQCSRYSVLDDKIIKKATELGLPLIGGTALELWAKVTNTPNVRTRSDNDIDVLSNSLSKLREFQAWVQEYIPQDKVQTDVLLVKSHDFSKWVVMVDGVLTMKPEYLLWSKLTRGSEKDKQDIKWILTIKSLKDEDIQLILDELGLTQEEADLLNECLNEQI